MTFEWQEGRSRKRAVSEDVHEAQRSVPVLVAERPTDTLFRRQED